MNTKNNSIGFLGFLTLMFIGLKLAGAIGWAWLWVLGPLWLPWAVILALAVAFFVLSWIYKVLFSKDEEEESNDAKK